jgi:hypothetical protein
VPVRPTERTESETRQDLRILAGVGGFSAAGAALSVGVALGPSYVGQAVMSGLMVLLFVAVSIGLGYEVAAFATAQEF